MLQLRVDAIKEGGLSLTSSIPWDELPMLVDVVAAKDCIFLAPVQVVLRAQLVGDLVEVEGSAITTLRFQCGGCLRDYDAPLESRFELTFARQLPVVEDAESGEEVELTADDLGIILFQGEEIDLSEAVQEQVIMALPLRRRCTAGCKGLCSQCGADLNQGECGCSRSNFNLKFAALEDFKVDKSS